MAFKEGSSSQSTVPRAYGTSYICLYKSFRNVFRCTYYFMSIYAGNVINDIFPLRWRRYRKRVLPCIRRRGWRRWPQPWEVPCVRNHGAADVHFSTAYATPEYQDVGLSKSHGHENSAVRRKCSLGGSHGGHSLRSAIALFTGRYGIDQYLRVCYMELDKDECPLDFNSFFFLS